MSLVQRPDISLFSSERREYRLIYFATFPLFLVVAALSRLLPTGVRSLTTQREGLSSILSEARATAHSVLPHAFMH